MRIRSRPFGAKGQSKGNKAGVWALGWSYR
nr:MAG TPA: hypothetical protein [Caudoviricetes sp.]